MLVKPSIREVKMTVKEVAKSRTINNLGNYKRVIGKEAFVIILRNVYIWPVQLKFFVVCLFFFNLYIISAYWLKCYWTRLFGYAHDRLDMLGMNHSL